MDRGDLLIDNRTIRLPWHFPNFPALWDGDHRGTSRSLMLVSSRLNCCSADILYFCHAASWPQRPHLKIEKFVRLMERLLWPVLALIALVSGQYTVTPTNSTPITFDAFAIQVGVLRPTTPAQPIANLLPLRRQALESLPVAVALTFFHPWIADRHDTRAPVNLVML